MKPQRLIIVLSSIILFLMLAGCSPWVVIEQGSNDQWIDLNASTSVGQSFVAEYPGLQAIYFQLDPKVAGDGTLSMHLRSSPSSQTDLASVSLPISEILTRKQYRFDFLPIFGSDNAYVYSVLTVDGAGTVAVGAGSPESYPDGSAYINNQPDDGQLSFSLDYDKPNLATGIAQEFVTWLGYLFVGLLLFTIPGWAIMSVLWSGWKKLFVFEKVAISIGVSLAFYALFVLFTYLLHLQLGKWYAWIPLVLGGAILLWQNRSAIATLFIPGRGDFRSIISDKQAFWTDTCLVIILGLVAFSRFWAMRGLVQPMWNDSLHHTEITQLILDNNGLFSSWLPYAAYKTFSMHFGFPLSASLYAWITGFASSQAVLFVGQILNILAPLALYPVVIRLTHGKRISAVIAVLVAGLLLRMPAYYINWGRYAQLAGQVLLPIVMWMTWDVVDSMNNQTGKTFRSWFPWLKIILTGGVIAGMVLFELRMIFVIATFALAFVLARLIKLTYHNWQKWLQELLAIFSIGIASILLFLPWGLRLQKSKLIDYAGFNSSVDTIWNMVVRDYQTWLNVKFYLPFGIIVLALVGLVWAAIKRDWLAVSIGVWVAFMAALYAFTILHIPWVQYVQSFAVLISLYIPAGILVGYLAGDVVSWISGWRPAIILALLVVIVLGMYGAWNQREISNPNTYALVTRSDMQAMKWIDENTPRDAKFLIEGTHENWVTNVIGTDAGWWIPLLANRENTIPPQYALSNEQPIEYNYSRDVVRLEAALEENSVASMKGIQLLCEYRITHVFIGQKQGSVGDRVKPLFTPDELADNPVFRLIYHKDRVYVFAVENACN